MKLSFITFHPGDETTAAAWVEQQLREMGMEHGGEQPCATVREFLALFAKELADHDVILLGVGSREFQRVKTTVSKAIGLPLTPDEKVLGKLSVQQGLDAAYVNALSSLPEGTQPLLTEDGLNSGFYAQSGTQHLLFMPIDEASTAPLCSNVIFPILMGLLFPEGVPCPLTPQELAEVQRAVRGLKEHQLLLSIAETSIAGAVADMMAQVPELSEVLVAPGENAVKCTSEEVMMLAKEVRREQQTAFGGAISCVTEEDGTGQIHVALAAPGRALRSQLSAPIQAQKNLRKTAVVCLCSMVSHQLSQMQAAKMAVAEKQTVKPVKSAGKVPLLFSILAVLAIIACVVLGFYLKSQGAKPQKPSAGSIAAVQVQTLQGSHNPIF